MSEKIQEIQAKYDEISKKHDHWTATLVVAELGKYFSGTEIAKWITQFNWDEDEE
jgi:hypothetical protein